MLTRCARLCSKDRLILYLNVFRDFECFNWMCRVIAGLGLHSLSLLSKVRSLKAHLGIVVIEVFGDAPALIPSSELVTVSEELYDL